MLVEEHNSSAVVCSGPRWPLQMSSRMERWGHMDADKRKGYIPVQNSSF